MLVAMAEIVFQVIALRLEGVVIFVFNLPPGPLGLNNLGHSVISNEVMGDEGIVVSDPTVRTADGEFTPVHPQRILSISEGHPIEIAVGPGFFNGSSPPFDDDRRQVNPLQVLIEGGVRVRTTDQDEVQLVVDELLTKGLVAIQVIAQHGHLQATEALPMLCQPPLSGGVLTVLFVMAILRSDKLKAPTESPDFVRDRR